MLKGLFSAVSGITALMQAQEVITNNIANVATPGFKRDIPVYKSFSTILRRELEGEERQSRMENTFIDFTQGEIESTERTLDLAIKGEGFFALLTPQGIAYTRAGNFTLDDKGRLITPQGYFLLGLKGPLAIPLLKAPELRINPQGEVMVDGEVMDRIRVDTFPDPPFYLYKEGENLFKVGVAGSTGKIGDSYLIKQGYLESSNVDILEEMVNLITNFRLYEAAQKAIYLQDITLEKICNQLR